MESTPPAEAAGCARTRRLSRSRFIAAVFLDVVAVDVDLLHLQERCILLDSVLLIAMLHGPVACLILIRMYVRKRSLFTLYLSTFRYWYLHVSELSFTRKQDHDKKSPSSCYDRKLSLALIGTWPHYLHKEQMTFLQQPHQYSTVPFCASPAATTTTKAKKRVQLHPIVLIQEYSLEPLTREEKAELYYSKSDMDNFMRENKEIALEHEFTQKMYNSDCTGEQDDNRSNLLAAEEDGFLRGIEMLIYPQRAQNKLIARKALMKYQAYLQTKRTDITIEQEAKAMRTASEKLSKWSHLVAQETARLDSLRAYDAEYLIPLDEQRVEFSPSPELKLFKRAARPFKKARHTI